MGIRHDLLLSAFLLSDGGISARGKGSWTIYFTNKDKYVIDEFQKTLQLSCGKSGYCTKKSNGAFFVKLHSKKHAERLFKLSKSYRTKACNHYPICRHLKGKRSSCSLYGTVVIDNIEYPNARIPKKIFNYKSVAIEFLKIYATCDGGISVVPTKNKYGSMFVVRKVFISVKHPILSNQITKLLRKLGFSPVQYKDQIRLNKKEDIEKFKIQIGFIKGSKISRDSKFLYGYDKNHILDIVVNSYKNPKNLLDFLQKTRFSTG